MKKQSIQTQLRGRGLKLNAEQMAAVAQLNGVSVVDAGAGSGKSTVIVSKILAANIDDPCCSVLAISFTKKAVAELQSRIVGAANVMVSTFHSFFYRILRSNGYKSFKFIENDARKRGLLRMVIDSLGLDEKVTVNDLADAITLGIFADDDIKLAFNAYLDTLKAKRLLCFDSLQYFTLELLRMRPAVAMRTKAMFDHVMIDEAQDLSEVQLEIIKLLWPADELGNNLTIVGDPKQSIYGFRGSRADAMEKLTAYYDANIFHLTTNYRCTASILSVANEVLPGEEVLVPAKKTKGKEPVFTAAANPAKEAQLVVDAIKKLHNEGEKLGDITILFRASVAASDVYEELIEQQVPFVKVGSDALKWNNSRFKHFLSLLAFAHDNNNQHYKCALPCLGIPVTVMSDMDYSNRAPFSKRLLNIPSLATGQRAALNDFFAIDADSHDLRDLSCILWNSYLKKFFGMDDDEVLDEWLEAIDRFQTFNELRDHVDKVRLQAKKMTRLANNPTADYIRLMSIHSAKGLEYKHIFVIGAADGILPSLGHDKVTDVAEENRLAYVAVTRAKEQLYVSYPVAHGQGTNEPSRFFKEFFK